MDLTPELTCPICLDVFTDPVSLGCDHHFCRSCISQRWKGETADASCPQCRQVFSQSQVRPARTLGNIVDKLRELEAEAERRDKGSYCQEHEEKLKVFCEEEHMAICLVCGMSRAHKAHSVIPIKEAAQTYKKKLGTSLEVLQEQLELGLQCKQEGVNGIFHLKAQVERLRNEVHSEFGKLHKFLFEKEELMNRELEQKSDEMLAEMETSLEETLDKVSALEGTIRDLKSRLEIQEATTFLKDIRDLLKRSEMKFHKPEAVSLQLHLDIVGDPLVYISLWKEMRTVVSPAREHLTLDPMTAHNQLILSQDLMSVRYADVQQNLPNLPERFDRYYYVLSSQSFTSGKHYWEVDLGNKTQWVVGVCRESIKRGGKIVALAKNGFWVINQTIKESLKIPGVTLQKLAVYLDYEGGQVIFCNAKDMSHLYTFTDTFTEKLYAIFNPCVNTNGDNSEPIYLNPG